MTLSADITVQLPFALDICAQGPSVDPLVCSVGGYACTLYFPPSLGEGTDGRGIFGDWAWWTGRSIRIILEQSIAGTEDADALRADAIRVANLVLRRVLNSYRSRFGKPEVYPVAVDPQALVLEVVSDNGRREVLPEPISLYLRRSQGMSPPLDSSVSSQTMALLQADVQTGTEQPLLEQFALDALLLEKQGEIERAAWLRKKIDESGDR